MLQTFPSGKINVAKNLLFFLLIAPLHHSFTFYSQFLYELNTGFISLKLCVCARAGVFVWVCLYVCVYFGFRFVFIKVYIFVQQKAWTLWLWNVKIKNNKQLRTALLSNLWFFSCNKWFENSMIFAQVWGPWKLPSRRTF